MRSFKSYDGGVLSGRQSRDLCSDWLNLVGLVHQELVVSSDGLYNSSGLDAAVPLLPVDLLGWGFLVWLVVVVD